MSAKHKLHVSAPIPPHLEASLVLAALHDHTTTLTLQALTQGHERLPAPDPTTLEDPYWLPTDAHPVTAYRVTELIQFLWLKRHIKFPSCFQDTPSGVRTRADASGVIVRAEFRVVEGAGEGWTLEEDAEVACARWMMPFVKGKMEEAHRDICAKIIEKVERESGQGVGGAAREE